MNLEVNPKSAAHSSTEQAQIDYLWDLERSLGGDTSSVGGETLVAQDFVSFDELGAAIAKSEIDRVLDHATDLSEPKLLWAHFGSAQSCCLAYLCPQNDGKPTVCMALWIERDGQWQKVFHHKNTNYS